jgi:hypothetical protein
VRDLLKSNKAPKRCMYCAGGEAVEAIESKFRNQTGICPRCLNEFDRNISRSSQRDNQTLICGFCGEEESRIDNGIMDPKNSENVYDRELRMRWLCPEGVIQYTDAGLEFMQECYIRKVITEVVIPRIKKLDE